MVQVFADATLVFPLLVAETFARRNGDNKHSPGPKRKKRYLDSDMKATSSVDSDSNFNPVANTSFDAASCTDNDVDGKASTDCCDTSSKVGDTKTDMDCDSNGDTKTNVDNDTDSHVNQAEIHEQ